MTELIMQNETNEDFPYEEMIKTVCEAVLKEENCNFDVEISLTLTDNEGIRKINNEFRGIDRATDVLSFPMLEFDENGCSDDGEFESDGDMIMLGDIVISLEKAHSQACEFGHSYKRELAFLTAHSMLHLLGYDHVDDEKGDRIMRQKQTKILDALSITRNGD